MLDTNQFARGQGQCSNNGLSPDISSISNTCFTQQEVSLPGWTQEYVQLTPAPFKGRVTQVTFEGLSIFRETVNQATINRFILPAGMAFVSVALRDCADAVSATGRLGARQAFLSHYAGEGECLNLGPVDFLGIVFPPEEALGAEIHRWTPLGAGAGPLGDWLAALIGAIAGGHAGADLQKIAPMLVADRLSLYLESRGTSAARPQALTRAAGVKLANDAMLLLRELPLEDLSVKTLSRYLGCPAATLRATFRAQCDSDLDAALVALRMSAVRRKLQAADPATQTVSALAADHGFLHWGRFAAAYRAMFGELPVETLRRRENPR